MNNYVNEVKELWGNTDAYKEYAKKTENYAEDKWQQVNDGLSDILSKFAQCMSNRCNADSQEAQELVKELQNYITDNYYTCTNDILAGLGQMYVSDERFESNINKHAQGTAEYISKAIKIYCKNKTTS